MFTQASFTFTLFPKDKKEIYDTRNVLSDNEQKLCLNLNYAGDWVAQS